MSAQNPPEYSTVPSADPNDDSKPPSYFDVIGQIKQAKNESKNPGELAMKSLSIVFGSVFLTLILLISSALPVAELVVGLLHRNDCPIQPKIPTWLIVMGACGLAGVVLKVIGNCFEFVVKRKNPEATQPAALNVVNCCLSIFLLIWFILGNVWVYNITKIVQYDPMIENYCDKVCYLFAFWSITVSWILLVFCCFCFCGLLCCAIGITSIVACVSSK